MKEVSDKQGRTVLFVSHNINAISKLCDTGIFLKNGTIAFHGQISNVVEYYNLDKKSNNTSDLKILKANKDAWLASFRAYNSDTQNHVSPMMPCTFNIEIESTKDFSNIYIGFGINDINEVRIFTCFSRSFFKSYNDAASFNRVKNFCCMEAAGAYISTAQ